MTNEECSSSISSEVYRRILYTEVLVKEVALMMNKF